MSKKKERIIEQIFYGDFKIENKRSTLSSGFKYLENLKFHSIAFCESKEQEDKEKRIIFLPRHIKALLNSYATERKNLISEIEYHKAELLKLQQANKTMMKNIEDKSLNEHNRPNRANTYSALFDDAAHQLKGVPLQGGLPSLGSKK